MGDASDLTNLQAELKALENRARELSACLKAMTLVGSSLNVDEVLDRAIHSAMDVMNAEAASLMLLDETTGELVFKQAAGNAALSVREIRIPRGHGIAGWVAQTGDAIVVEDAQNDPRFFRGADDHTGFVTRSILAVPLRVKDRIIGVAEAINKVEGRFSESDLPLFTAYAALAAIAIENARMHQTITEQEVWAREIDIARQIQNGLQGPSNAALGHLRFNALSVPARSVGGDFYDWIEIGDGRALMVIGDVSGKGIPAALLMSNTISRLRAEAARLVEPKEILSALNQALFLTAQRGLFVTVFLALIDTDNVMTYASAGHHIPLYWNATGFQKLPAVTGPPIAILAESSYTQSQITLEEGDIFVMFTDGVTEAVSEAGEFFGYDCLEKIIEKGHDNPELLPTKIRVAVEAFEIGTEQTDDVTIGVLSWGNSRPELVLNFDHMSPDDLAGLRTSLEAFLGELDITEKNRTKLVLAVDEACTNIIRHAYGGRGGPAMVHCWKAGNELQFRLTDFGCGLMPKFPASPPPTAGRLEELRPGGLGLVILREVMDEVRYETGSTGGCILRMKKSLES